MDVPILLSVGDHASVRELVERHRGALAGASADDDRGRLHLTIGTHLARLGANSHAEAIEEFRQALRLIAAETDPFEHAMVRLHLGGLLQELARAHAMADRIPAARSAGEEALYHLEQAHRALVLIGPAASRIESTRRYAHALSFRGRFDDVYALLERERQDLTGEHRQWIELYLAEHALGDPEYARQEQGLRILDSCFSDVQSIPAGADDFIVYLIGTTLPRLPIPVTRLALEWLEQREDTPVDLLASVRSKVYPNEPERWMSKYEREKLDAMMPVVAPSSQERQA